MLGTVASGLLSCVPQLLRSGCRARLGSGRSLSVAHASMWRSLAGSGDTFR